MEDHQAKKPRSEIEEILEAIKLSFDTKWLSEKQSESSSFSSKHVTMSTTNRDSSSYTTTPNNVTNIKRTRPKANRVETSSELALPDQHVRGFVNEILFLKNFLIKRKESEKFKILAIVGKYGVGKTTLCQVVFKDKDVKEAYLPRIWVSMYNKETEENENPKISTIKRILRSLGVEEETLKHIKAEAEEDKRSKDEAGEREEETIQEKELSLLLYALNEILFGKKYLIVLDDVWEDNEWDQNLGEDNEKILKERTHLSWGFPKGYGGRVIVTSRDEDLAKKIVGGEENVQRLYPRTDVESVWEIYNDAVEMDMNVNPRYPGRFRQELMDKSCGVPLAARMLAKIEPVKMD